MLARLIAAIGLVAAVPAAAQPAPASEPLPIPDTVQTRPISFRSGSFVLVGVTHRSLTTGPTAIRRHRFPFDATEELPMPEATLFAVPVLSGWTIAYGDPPAARGPLPNDDHHFGLGHVDVSIVGFARGRVTVRVQARLADWNHDDRWWANINYHVLFFGPAAPTRPPGEEEQEPG